MPKKDIHPEWFEETQVYCDGQLVMTTSSTKPNLYIDVWSGNHPFYTGSLKVVKLFRSVTGSGRERNYKKYRQNIKIRFSILNSNISVVSTPNLTVKAAFSGFFEIDPNI